LAEQSSGKKKGLASLQGLDFISLGCWPEISARLNEGCIHTVLDLINADVATLRRQFSVVLEKLCSSCAEHPALTSTMLRRPTSKPCARGRSVRR
jgi:hypothetical protein